MIWRIWASRIRILRSAGWLPSFCREALRPPASVRSKVSLPLSKGSKLRTSKRGSASSCTRCFTYSAYSAPMRNAFDSAAKVPRHTRLMLQLPHSRGTMAEGSPSINVEDAKPTTKPAWDLVRSPSTTSSTFMWLLSLHPKMMAVSKSSPEVK